MSKVKAEEKERAEPQGVYGRKGWEDEGTVSDPSQHLSLKQRRDRMIGPKLPDAGTEYLVTGKQGASGFLPRGLDIVYAHQIKRLGFNADALVERGFLRPTGRKITAEEIEQREAENQSEKELAHVA